MRQVAIDAASIPKDAKIAALEKTSAESEKLIAEARSDKMRSFEEMQESQVGEVMNSSVNLGFLMFFKCFVVFLRRGWVCFELLTGMSTES